MANEPVCERIEPNAFDCDVEAQRLYHHRAGSRLVERHDIGERHDDARVFTVPYPDDIHDYFARSTVTFVTFASLPP